MSKTLDRSRGIMCKNARVDTFTFGTIIYSWRPVCLLVWFLSCLPLTLPEEWVFLKGLATEICHVPGPPWHPHPPDLQQGSLAQDEPLSKCTHNSG